MIHISMVLQLRTGCLEAYRNAHDQIWPELAESMRENDVSMAIFHYEGRLFVFATASSQEHWERSRTAPVLAEWNRRMTEYLYTTGDEEIDVRFPEQVFGFGVFESTGTPQSGDCGNNQ